MIFPLLVLLTPSGIYPTPIRLLFRPCISFDSSLSPLPSSQRSSPGFKIERKYSQVPGITYSALEHPPPAVLYRYIPMYRGGRYIHTYVTHTHLIYIPFAQLSTHHWYVTSILCISYLEQREEREKAKRDVYLFFFPFFSSGFTKVYADIIDFHLSLPHTFHFWYSFFDWLWDTVYNKKFPNSESFANENIPYENSSLAIFFFFCFCHFLNLDTHYLIFIPRYNHIMIMYK